METKEWLESLKPGDAVAFYGPYDNISIRTIERLTKNQLVLDNGVKFWLSNGYMVGGNAWNNSVISELTKEFKKRIRIKNIRQNMARVEFEKLSITKQERILAIVNEAENGQAE